MMADPKKSHGVFEERPGAKVGSCPDAEQAE